MLRHRGGEEDRNEGCLQLSVALVLVAGNEPRSRPTLNDNPAPPKAGALLRPRRRELFHGLAMHRHRKAAEG